MSNIVQQVIEARLTLWDEHPIIAAKAVLPTPAALAAHAQVKQNARRHRSSLGFYAQPMTGKSSCIVMLQHLLQADFPGSGFFVYEAKEKALAAEGAFLEDMLDELEYEPKLQRTLTGKRNQVRRALYAFACPRKHLFLVIDEAQELIEKELKWLKSIINWLCRNDVRVTVVLFGQIELLSLRDELVASGRSDLDIRYTDKIYEFRNVQSAADIQQILEAMDQRSEYPQGSKWTYTQFGWPRAFASGMRLAPLANAFWLAFIQKSPVTRGTQGISMQWIARALACLMEATRNADHETFRITPENWADAIEAAGYVDRKPVLPRKQRANSNGEASSRRQERASAKAAESRGGDTQGSRSPKGRAPEKSTAVASATEKAPEASTPGLPGAPPAKPTESAQASVP